MSDKTVKVLLIEDNPEHAQLIQAYALRDRDVDYALDLADRLKSGQDMAETTVYDVILLDLNLPDSRGLDTLTNMLEQAPSVPVVVLTAFDDTKTALKAVQAGAQDYLGKGEMSTEMLSRSIQYAIERKRTSLALEDRNRELTAFSSVASHDLQAPLRRIIQWCGHLREDLENGEKKEVDKDIDIIVGQAQTMTALIKDLLEYAKSGRGEKVFEPVGLAEVVEAALTNLEVDVQQSGAKIEVEPLPKVMGDRVALIQLFQNLISNSIKYQADPRPEVRIAAQAKGDLWQITVEDNGIGIAPGDQARIFEPFKRVDAQYQGTGIGLAICRRIVDQHHGKIWLESELGQGATFFVTLLNAAQS